MKKKLILLLSAIIGAISMQAADTYTVAGTTANCNGQSWNATATINDMTLVSGTTYRLVVTDANLEANTNYEWKVLKNHSWGNAGENNWPASGNKTFTVTENGEYTITYTFDSSTKTLSETTTKTGEGTVVTHDYYITGDNAACFGTTWSPGVNKMSTEDDDTYTFSVSGISITAPTTIEYKICQDGGWDVSYGDNGGSSNAWLYIAYPGVYNITFTFVNSTSPKTVQAEATRTNGITPVTVKFQKPAAWAKAYLYAWNGESKLTWPGEEMTADGDWYKFVINSGDSIIFNNGLDGDALIQSSDIPSVTADVCYLWQDDDAVLDEDCDGAITVAADVYAVVGTHQILNGDNDWAAAADDNLMTETTTGVYTLVVTDATLEAGVAYEYKICKNSETYIPDGANKTITVTETAVYKITYTYKTAGDEITAVTEKTGEAGTITHTYNVAGAVKLPTDEGDATGDFLDGDSFWTATENQMATEDDINYTLTFTDVEIDGGSTVQFKICQDGAWGVSYGWDDEGNPGSGNAWIYIEDAGTYTFTFSFNAETHVVGVLATRTDVAADVYAVVGTHQILNGDNDWAAAADDNLMTETTTGVYTLVVTDATLEAGVAYEYKICKNSETYIPDGANKTITVTETAVYKITYTYKTAGDEITAVTEKTGEAGTITHTYNVAGAVKLPTDEGDATGDFLDGDSFWTATENQMATEDDINYTLTFTDVEIDGGSTVQFKICQDGAWGVSYGWDDEGNPGSGNAWIYIEDAGTYTFTFTFNADTHVVGVSAQRTDVAADVYVVAGSGAALNGLTWNATATENQMTLVGDVYTLVVTDALLEAGITYEFKIVKNGTQYIPDGTGNNRTFTVNETALYKVTYTYKIEGEEISVVTEKTGEAGPVTHTYTIAGAAAIVNGSEWEPTNTDNDMILDDATGLYTLVVTNCELQVSSNENIYGFKVVVDHSWGVAYPSSDWIINVTEAGTYDITYTFNEATKDINAVLSKKDTPTAVETIALDPNQPMYNILGIEVGKNYRGIVIQNGQKFLR